MMARRVTSIVVADDHPIVLHAVTGLLNSQADMKVIASCSDGTAAVDAIRKWSPDIAVLDIAMPGFSGLDVLASIAAANAATKVIFLTATAKDDQLLTALARGAKGIMLKDTALQDLVRCVREVAAGRNWFPTDVVDAALERETGRRLQRELIEEGLTARERQVMLLVSEGLSNKEIGRRLGLSEGTIKIHLHNIYEKIGVPNRTALTAVAIAHRDELVS